MSDSLENRPEDDQPNAFGSASGNGASADHSEDEGLALPSAGNSPTQGDFTPDEPIPLSRDESESLQLTSPEPASQPVAAAASASDAPAEEAEPAPAPRPSRSRPEAAPVQRVRPKVKLEDVVPLDSKEAIEAQMNWYILKVQSNREDSIRDGLLRRVKKAGLEPYFGEIIVPTEMVTEFKNGRKRISKRKLFPGYLVARMVINDDTWFLVRETPGIGDFTGSAGRPSPMLPHEVAKMVSKQAEESVEAPKLKIAFNKGDRVKISEGTFANYDGEVEQIDEANGRVTVMINIFGRSTPVEFEFWQVEAIH